MFAKTTQYSYTIITLIKTHLSSHVYPSSITIIVSFSTLFWAQPASLFDLSVSLSGCWALVFYTAGQSLPTAPCCCCCFVFLWYSALSDWITKIRVWQISHLHSQGLEKSRFLLQLCCFQAWTPENVKRVRLGHGPELSFLTCPTFTSWEISALILNGPKSHRFFSWKL